MPKSLRMEETQCLHLCVCVPRYNQMKDRPIANPLALNEYIQNWDGGGYVEVPETWKLLTGVADICTYTMP